MNRPQRLFELDALRGMSLLGIVLMNILIFSFPYDNIDLTKHLSGFDVTIIRSVKLIIISSFYPIFTFLFGYGLSIMYQNTQRKQLRFYPIIYRRLFFLLVVGLLHGYFIFSGDILFTYAVTGMVAVLLIKLSKNTLTNIALILFMVKIIVILMPVVILHAMYGPDNSFNMLSHSVQDLINSRQSSSYLDFLPINMEENNYSILDTLTISAIFEFLPYILIGIAAQKFDLISHIRAVPQKYLKWGILAIVVGYIYKLPSVIYYADETYKLVSSLLAGPIVATGYILVFCYLCQTVKGKNWLSVFAFPGKLSMSVYLTQSIIFLYIYTGAGFGLYNKLTLAQSYTLAILVYMVQLVVSYLYLKRYKQGSFEWIWRKFTYLK
ncbi:DUF418 domain-containing protein [Staphylococcus arlettae]|uniref:DUF418 domain-containing protein n=1 Tax=Staphylococcus arlettae TaxID=29378 RepID=UPI000D19856F|nr:DUF418 domain-containing protein [Staphylococcus arlettae]PTH30739.1 DUF418 domain-containing protein [Staphylococcus arlettae]PTH54841.1 DUF418 domain-containing protein [Staphylococcus arlettae]